METLLDGTPKLCQLIGLDSVPCYRTFPQASRKLLNNVQVQTLLEENVKCEFGPSRYVAHIALDSTGMECTAASSYFIKYAIEWEPSGKS